MSWTEVTEMEEIIRFVSLAKTNRYQLTALCEQFGISRKTGYKYLARFEAEGFKGLRTRSHRPLSSPQEIEKDTEQLVKAERELRPRWGPKKLQEVLRGDPKGSCFTIYLESQGRGHSQKECRAKPDWNILERSTT